MLYNFFNILTATVLIATLIAAAVVLIHWAVTSFLDLHFDDKLFAIFMTIFVFSTFFQIVDNFMSSSNRTPETEQHKTNN